MSLDSSQEHTLPITYTIPPQRVNENAGTYGDILAFCVGITDTVAPGPDNTDGFEKHCVILCDRNGAYNTDTETPERGSNAEGAPVLSDGICGCSGCHMPGKRIPTTSRQPPTDSPRPDHRRSLYPLDHSRRLRISRWYGSSIPYSRHNRVNVSIADSVEEVILNDRPLKRPRARIEVLVC